MPRRVNWQRKLETSAKRLQTAQRERDELIRRAALEGGLSRRQIAQAAGLSHQRVQQIIASQRTDSL